LEAKVILFECSSFAHLLPELLNFLYFLNHLVPCHEIEVHGVFPSGIEAHRNIVYDFLGTPLRNCLCLNLLIVYWLKGLSSQAKLKDGALLPVSLMVRNVEEDEQEGLTGKVKTGLRASESDRTIKEILCDVALQDIAIFLLEFNEIYLDTFEIFTEI
jgi:hypothetical protein